MDKFKIYRTRFLALLSLGISLVLLSLFSAITTYSSEQLQTAPEAKSTNISGQTLPVSGAGAHFAWILFKELQAEIEEHIERPIKLYGEDSMYGVGCNAGIKMAQRNSADMETFGFACCPLSPEEIKKHHLTIHPLVWEPIMIITHESNPIESLTIEQVRRIFSGQIMNWNEVGGQDKSIVVVTRLHCGKRPGHWKTILPNKSDFREERINVRGAEPMVRSVSDFSNSIGHVGSGWEIKPTDKIKIIKVNGYEPTPSNIKSKKYPFYRMQSIITHGPISKAVKSIIDFMKNSKAFKRVAEKYRMLPVEH